MHTFWKCYSLFENDAEYLRKKTGCIVSNTSGLASNNITCHSKKCSFRDILLRINMFIKFLRKILSNQIRYWIDFHQIWNGCSLSLTCHMEKVIIHKVEHAWQLLLVDTDRGEMINYDIKQNEHLVMPWVLSSTNYNPIEIQITNKFSVYKCKMQNVGLNSDQNAVKKFIKTLHLESTRLVKVWASNARWKPGKTSRGVGYKSVSLAAQNSLPRLTVGG